MKKIILSVAVILIMAACKKSSAPALVIDNNSTVAEIIDSNNPGSDNLIIGTQKWKKKNLNVSRYRNGDKIPQVKDGAAFEALTTGAWCYYNNDPANGAIYGKLYNWYAVNDPRGLAPAGWHIPSDAEWTTLSDFLGGDELAGGKMKEAGTAHWSAPNEGATNSSLFTGLPGGGRYSGLGTFAAVGDNGSWWSSTEHAAFTAWARWLSYNGAYCYTTPEPKRHGFSVRCVKD